MPCSSTHATFQDAVMCKTSDSALIELRVTRAYIRLFLVPEDEHGTRTVSLARIGRYEVRMAEVSCAGHDGTAPLWIDLYAHDIQSSIDSCSCNDLEEAIVAAEQLISQAKQLNEIPRAEAESSSIKLKPMQTLLNYKTLSAHFGHCLSA